jgi:Fe-S-cluster-containing dehydrogenase component
MKTKLTRREVIQAFGSGAGLLVIHCGPNVEPETERLGYDWTKHYWVYVIDLSKCIGCGACQRACRAENDVPDGCHRTWVERYRVMKNGRVDVDVATGKDHVFKRVEGEVEKAYFVPKLCNHCEKAPCTQVCPVGASYRTKDGVVLVDDKHCVGCGYCLQACPYGVRFLDPRSGTAGKCTFCYHRITRGLMPACVQVCPKAARRFGDLKNPDDPIHRLLRERRHRMLKPELGTAPKCYYLNLDVEVV